MVKTLADLAELSKIQGIKDKSYHVPIKPKVVYMRNYRGCEGSCEDLGSDYGGGCDRSGGCDHETLTNN